MNRRTALAVVVHASGSPDEQESGGDIPSVFANTVLPKVSRTTAGLEPYTGQWDVPQKLHLLRRTMFGVSKADFALLNSMTVEQAVTALCTPPPEEASQPLCYDSKDDSPGVGVGTTWVNALYKNPASTYNPVSTRTNSLKAWWISLMLNQPLSVREKMTLLWHNHLVTATGTVGDPRFTYRYLSLLRTFALGNLKTLLFNMTTDGAMLRYLNGNSNTKSSPNENYGRELQELFTIGKGPEVAPGDYTTYTEADVKAAARVLTGWKDLTQSDGTVGSATSTFDPTRHDTTNKTFSARYGNRVITGGTDGAREINDLLTMIFNEPETARFFARKLYRWFIYYVIDDWTEANIITPIADTLRSANYEVAPVLRLLLKSAHFFDPANMGCQIKSPLDLTVGTSRMTGIVFPPTDTVQQYTMWNYLWTQASTQQQNLGDPPDVSGWHAYYQTPQFYELWINSDTLPKRTRFTDTLVRSGYTSAGATILIDPFSLVQQTSNPLDPNVIIDELSQWFFAIPLTGTQKAFLKNTMLPQLPDYEWTTEWKLYLSDPNNAANIASMKSKLKALLAVMMEMPEFQLC